MNNELNKIKKEILNMMLAHYTSDFKANRKRFWYRFGLKFLLLTLFTLTVLCGAIYNIIPVIVIASILAAYYLDKSLKLLISFLNFKKTYKEIVKAIKLEIQKY